MVDLAHPIQFAQAVPAAQAAATQVAAVVLAAGESRRLGQPKQLVQLEGEALLRRTARLALEAGCSPVVVVLGAAASPCREVLAGLDPEEASGDASAVGANEQLRRPRPPAPAGRVRLVVNPDWREGMSTSLRAGLAALGVTPAAGPDLTPARFQRMADSAGDAMAPDAQLARVAAGVPSSTLILVSDQYRLTVASLLQLLGQHSNSSAPATAARYGGRLGVPAIFRAELLPALAALTGDQGARRLLEAWRDQVACVDLPEASAEVDTANDLLAMQQWHRAG